VAAGDKVLATARDVAALDDLAARYADQVRTYALDVTDELAAQSAVEAAIKAFGQLDVVVNNAGYGNIKPIEGTSLQEFREQLETNLFGTIIVTKAALPHFRTAGSGQFIQFSSIGGRMGPPGRGPYSTAKWGVEGFSEVLSREVGPLGIKVTIVEPGGFRTDFAGKSTKLEEGDPAYDATVGATARFQRQAARRSNEGRPGGREAHSNRKAATAPSVRAGRL
jgi:NAD(P)-dependent dehydrogenase (short-subunit alcohol dehydrogenase family)